MLDQNTDRMWFVIGAVIVGAAIIFIANGTLPDIFASVTDTFSSATSSATMFIEDSFGGSNIITSDDLEAYVSSWQTTTVKDYDPDTDTWTIELPENPGRWSRGLRVKQSAISVPYGARFTTRYEVFVPKEAEGAMVRTDINNSYASVGYHGIGNDNDNTVLRQYGIYENGRRVAIASGEDEKLNLDKHSIPIKAGEWTTVWYSYENTSSANINKEALYDYSNIGTTNPLEGPLEIKIRNVYGSLVDKDGRFIDETGEEIN